jgi:FtsH-binding integral membrane protein
MNQEMKTIDSAAVPGADSNSDGHICKPEMDLHLAFKRKELEDQDAQRDAMRKMTWFALFGMLLYPITIIIASSIGLDDAAKIIGDIAPTYFVAIAGLVSVFFSANAYAYRSKKDS